MTVESNLNIWGPYYGNDVTTAFPYTNTIFAATHLIVLRRTLSTGAVTTLVLNSDYSVTGINNVNGGNVVTFVPLPSAYALWIFRIVDVLQLTDFKNQGAFHAQFHEDAFDWGAMIDQQLQEQLQRSLIQEATTSHRNMVLYPPVAGGLLRYRSDLSGVEPINISNVSSGTMTAALAVPGVPFASSPTFLDTNVSKFAWDNIALMLKLMGTARYTMAGGVYPPAPDGNNDFCVLTTGSTKVAGSSQGLRKATWSFFDTNTSDNDNAVIKVDVLSTSNPGGTYKKTGIHVQAFTLPDNGGDCSGILSLQTGGGNAITAYHLNGLRPVGQTMYPNNGYALEVGSDTSTAAALFQVGLNGVGSYTQGIAINLNTATAKGIVFQPTTGGFDGRIAIETAQYTPGAVNALPTWQLSLGGVQVGNEFSGPTLIHHYELAPQALILQRKASDAGCQSIHFQKDRLDADVQNNDQLHQVSIEGKTGGVLHQLAVWSSTIIDAAGGSEDVVQTFSSMLAGTVTAFMQLVAPTADQTSLLLLSNVGGTFTLKRVFMGAADSGGAGFRMLRVVN